jgi:hypothetical protein
LEYQKHKIHQTKNKLSHTLTSKNQKTQNFKPMTATRKNNQPKKAKASQNFATQRTGQRNNTIWAFIATLTVVHLCDQEGRFQGFPYAFLKAVFGVLCKIDPKWGDVLAEACGFGDLKRKHEKLIKNLRDLHDRAEKEQRTQLLSILTGVFDTEAEIRNEGFKFSHASYLKSRSNDPKGDFEKAQEEKIKRFRKRKEEQVRPISHHFKHLTFETQ